MMMANFTKVPIMSNTYYNTHDIKLFNPLKCYI